MNDGQSHQAVFRLDRNATLIIDGGLPQVDDNQINDYLNVARDYLYVGGHPEDISDITGARFDQGFEGCINNIGIMHYNKENKNPPKYGLSRIPFNKKNYFLDQSNVKCVKMCRVWENTLGHTQEIIYHATDYTVQWIHFSKSIFSFS